MKKYNQNLNSIPTHKESCCNGLEKLSKEPPQLIQKLLITNWMHKQRMKYVSQIPYIH